MTTSTTRRAPILRMLLLVSAATLLAPAATWAAADVEAPAIKVSTPRASAAAPSAYSIRKSTESLYRVTADFRSPDGDPLSVSFAMERSASRQSMQEFGISSEEINALEQACRTTQNCQQREFDQRLTQYFREHKLRLRSVPGQRPRLFVDIPAVVRHSRAHVQPVSAALQQLAAEQGQDADWIFASAVAMVQSGLEYRTPQALEGGRQTLGFYTPSRALEKGYGDCDTKSALLASILQNLGTSRIVGVRIPGHYLLGVARTPEAGQAFVQYQGESFVLLEAAGPAQRPLGEIAAKTRLALERGDEIRFDPMF